MQMRIFTFQDQLSFAELSGDNNPLHLDEVVARRCLFGRPVIHGVHLLLWSLNGWLQEKCAPITLRSLKANFLKPAGLNETVQYSIIAEKEGWVKIEVVAAGAVSARIVCEWVATKCRHLIDIPNQFPELHAPRVVSPDKLAAQSGTLGLFLHTEAVTHFFPHLMRCFSPSEIGVMLATTRLVGVECPGLNSVYSDLSLLADNCVDEAVLAYRVTSIDERFNLVCMQVNAPSLSGKVRAFIRPAPHSQAAYTLLQPSIGEREFAGQRALILGGSRGLGEVTAKILCAGGAEVKLTYYLGETDARLIVNEITRHGGKAGSFHYDALNPDGPALAAALHEWRPTHLYYFATPFISVSPKREFSSGIFEKFSDYYVVGFASLIDQLRKFGLKYVFYPSTVYVDEMSADFVEYAKAKAAGEALCASYQKNYPGMIFYCPRLPRMATDQTSGLLAVQNPDPSPIMINFLRNFRDCKMMA